MYGVDVTGVMRRFTDQEMATLGTTGQQYVFQERARIRGQQGGGRYPGSRGGRGGGRGRGNGGAGRGAAGNDGRRVAEVQTGDENREPQRDAGGAAQNDRGGTNGRRFGPGAYGTADGADGDRDVGMITCGPK